MILCAITLENIGLNDEEQKVRRDKTVGGFVTRKLPGL